jgi:hypothetical protein
MLMSDTDDTRYIYESPDGGKTVTRREFGSLTKEAYYGVPEFPEDEMLPDQGVDLTWAGSNIIDVSDTNLIYGNFSYQNDTNISLSSIGTERFSLSDFYNRLETIEKRLTILVPDDKLKDKYQVLQDLYDQYKAAETLLSGPSIEE